MTIGERLLKLRKYLNYEKQEDFAQILGVSPKTYWRYETDNGDPSYSFLCKIINKWEEISPAWLLADVGEMSERRSVTDNHSTAIADNHSIANVHGTINGASITSEVEKNIVFEQGDMRLIFPKDTPQDVISSTIAAAAHSTTTPSRTAITMRFLGPVANVAGRGLELCFTRLVDGKQDKNEIAQGIFAAFQEWEKEFEQFKIDKISEDIVSV